MSAVTDITDARLDVIGRARDVLERARLEYGAHCDRAKMRVLPAMRDLERALTAWGEARLAGEEAVNSAVADCAWKGLALVQAAGDAMGDEAAAYIAAGEGDEGE